MNEKKGKESISTGMKYLSLVLNIGITFGASVMIGYYMGHYLDLWLMGKWHYETPWFTLFFILMGIGAGFKGVFRMLAEIEEERKE